MVVVPTSWCLGTVGNDVRGCLGGLVTEDGKDVGCGRRGQAWEGHKAGRGANFFSTHVLVVRTKREKWAWGEADERSSGREEWAWGEVGVKKQAREVGVRSGRGEKWTREEG